MDEDQEEDEDFKEDNEEEDDINFQFVDVTDEDLIEDEDNDFDTDDFVKEPYIQGTAEIWIEKLMSIGKSFYLLKPNFSTKTLKNTNTNGCVQDSL